MNRKKTITIMIIILLLLIAAVLIFIRVRRDCSSSPEVSAADVTANGPESVVSVDISVDKLGDTLYPAASFSISFDNTHLEFLELNDGNLEIISPSGRKLPSWCCNVEKSNELGVINVMYLDTTGGTEAFSEQAAQADSVVFRLSFRVRGNAVAGDKYPIDFIDAVFAADDESESLAMYNGSLSVSAGKITIGG